MIAMGMRRLARMLILLPVLLAVCVELSFTYSGSVYADWCTSEYYNLKGDGYIHYRQHPCEIAVNEICHIWRVKDLALRKRVDAYNARCAGTPERLIENPNDRGNRYQQQPLQQHHAQAHPPKGTGASAGKIQSYQDAVEFVRARVPKGRVTTPGARETRLVDSEQELRAIEKHLTHGLTPKRVSTPDGLIKVYSFNEGTKINVRDFSTSGGSTIDIIPVKKTKVTPEIRLHIKNYEK